MNPNRQTELCWIEETNEYQVKLFINGVYDPLTDYFTEDLKDAVITAEAMRNETNQQNEDFCKEQEARQRENQTEGLKYEEWPIYADDVKDLVGWIKLEDSTPLPKVLLIQDKLFVQTKMPKVMAD